MPSGGIIGYFGYEYQFFVTTLLMLNAHGIMNSSFKLSIETLFGDDAELEHNKIKTLYTEQVVNNEITQIQVKTKQQTQHWRPADVRELLLKRDERVNNGRTVLDKLYSYPNSKFLFITDGSVAENLACLLSEQIGAPQHKYGDGKLKDIRKAIISSDRLGKHRKILTRKLTKDVLSRIFIVANLSFENVERQIRELLLWNYGIPTHQVYEKTEALAGMIRECARRKNEKSFVVSSDIIEIAGTPGVKLPYQEVELLYQKTDEYDLAKRILNQKHMVLISGEPGFGKTTLAYKLANEQANQHYHLELIGGEDSHLNILRACLSRDNVVLLLDDGFGSDEYKDNLGAALGNNFEQIALQLQETNGRVKVLITSRHDVIAQVYTNTKLTPATLNNHIISIPFSSPAFNITVLKAHLKYLRVKSEVAEAVVATPLLSEKFENLHHVRTFAYALIKLEEIPLPENFLSILEETKPSLYRKWIEKQPLNIQLFLISLWLILEVNQFAQEVDIKSVFNTLSLCASLPVAAGFTSPYGSALKELLVSDRILIRRNNIVDFIHPTLKKAVSDFFKNSPAKPDFTTCVIDSLAKIDHPLMQSAAVYLSINNLGESEQFEKLSLASSSKYLQVMDTIVRFGKSLLESQNEQLRQLGEKIYSKSFHPSECIIDEHNYLIVPNVEDSRSYDMSELSEIFEWETIGFREEKEPELVIKFQKSLDEQSFMLLNPLERYKLLDWLFDQYKSKKNKIPAILDIVEFTSADPISFVRQRVAEHLETILDTAKTQTIIEFLCYDSSPHVKIAVLEDVILRTWSKQNSETQKLWLDLAVSMLDDSVVRYRCTRGLVDQSGTFYYYHQEHTEEQKREWFAAIALKLLNHTFEADNVDRFLSAFDKQYLFFSTEFRVELLNSLNSYVVNNPYHATSIVPTAKNIIFNKDTSKEEFDVLLTLINHVPQIAKGELGFDMARRFTELPDERFKEFINRPFYIEDPQEYVFERAAIILGYLANPSVTKELGELPVPIREMGGDSESAINNYIDKQNDEFKLILLFAVFGHKYASEISAIQHSLYLHPVIKKLIDEFIIEKQDTPNTIALAYSLLTDGYYCTNADHGKQTEWLRYLDTLLSSKHIDLLKAICDILFQANIDSSVHNTKDWLDMLSRLLTHPVEDVRVHASALYDKYFLDIWPDMSYLIREERKNSKKATHSLWLDNAFFQYLLSVCPSFNEFVETKLLFKKFANNWAGFSEKQRILYVKLIANKADSDKYYLNALIEEFVDGVGDELRVDHKKIILSAITPGGEEYNKTDVIGRRNYLHSSQDLRELLPRFDWSKYIN